MMMVVHHFIRTRFATTSTPIIIYHSEMHNFAATVALRLPLPLPLIFTKCIYKMCRANCCISCISTSNDRTVLNGNDETFNISPLTTQNGTRSAPMGGIKHAHCTQTNTHQIQPNFSKSVNRRNKKNNTKTIRE